MSARADRHKVLLNELDNLAAGAPRAEVIAKQRRIIAAVEALIRELRPETGPRRCRSPCCSSA